MFVPSESVYAELHDGFDDVMQKAYRAQVVLVSPSLLMLAIQVMQQIQKDARMREAADKIHAEVGHLMDDIKRLQRARAEAAEALRPGQRGRAANPHLGRKGGEARRAHREVEFDDDGAGSRPATSSRRRSRASRRWGSDVSQRTRVDPRPRLRPMGYESGADVLDTHDTA